MQIGQMCPNLVETEKQAYNKIANEKYYTKILRRKSSETLFAPVTLNYKKLQEVGQVSRLRQFCVYSNIRLLSSIKNS